MRLVSQSFFHPGFTHYFLIIVYLYKTKHIKKLVFLLIFPIFSFGQVDYKNASELLKSGISKVKSEDYDGALKDFNLAIERDTKGEILDTIYFQRAQLKRRKFKDYNGALKDYNTSLEYNKNYVASYIYRSYCLKEALKIMKLLKKTI